MRGGADSAPPALNRVIDVKSIDSIHIKLYIHMYIVNIHNILIWDHINSEIQIHVAYIQASMAARWLVHTKKSIFANGLIDISDI